MAKGKKSIFFCQNCGHEESKWLGQCPMCKEWNTFVEEKVSVTRGSTAAVQQVRDAKDAKVVTLSSITTDDDERMQTGILELDRVLGGGIVPGSLVLVGGDPGIGKSTLLLQVCQKLSGQTRKILYISGEESLKQIKLRANRMGTFSESLFLLCETNLGIIRHVIEEQHPDMVVIDSIQTMYNEEVASAPGSVSQVRESTNVFMQLAKGLNISIFIVGHVTKEGTVAGPRVLEHMVDTVLQFEGDQQYMYRILRSMKNRFGSTSEIGIYEMLQSGLRQVTNPSELLLSNHDQELSGIAVSATVEGVRPILLEVQSLVSTAAYGVPQRSATGFDSRRLNMLLAVLEKRVGFKLAAKDVFLNIAGGIRVSDPALDLAVVMAVLSSNIDAALPADTVFAGEVGLSGEIRAVSRIEQRISEAEKLGFKRIFVPLGNKKGFTRKATHIEVAFVSRIADICRSLFG